MRATIVIPCYNEQHRLPVERFDEFLRANGDVGFVLVNDGSRDGTLDVLRALESRWPERVSVIDQQPNQGKAEAVRRGMLDATRSGAEFVGYWDADLATPLEAIGEFAQVLDERPDIEFVLGARLALLGRDIERKPLRHYLGRVFATVASLVLGIAVYDTQCGAKLMRSTPRMRALFQQSFNSRWIFDVELLARYLVSGAGVSGLYELPLRSWHDVGKSTLRPVDFLRAIGEMAAIYRSYRLRRSVGPLFALLASPAVRYAAAGAVGTVLHYATLTTAVELFGISPPIGAGLGALVGAIVNYLLNYHVTFASTASHLTTAPKFFLVALLSVGLNAGGMWLAMERLGLHYLPAQILCTATVLVIGFLLNKSWTFASARLFRASQPPVGKADASARDGSAERHAAEKRSGRAETN